MGIKRYKFVDGIGLPTGLDSTNTLKYAIQNAVDYECEVIDIMAKDSPIVFSAWDGWNVDYDYYDKAVASDISKNIALVGDADKQLQFTQDELQLLYAACMSYGDKLSQILKSIPNEGDAVLDRLSDRAKDSWDLARKITGFME